MKIFKWMFTQNTWLWFHALAGGIGAKILLAIPLSKENIVQLVFIVSAIWEGIEWVTKNSEMEEIYGSYERAVFDSLGDIIAATIMAAVVVL